MCAWFRNNWSTNLPFHVKKSWVFFSKLKMNSCIKGPDVHWENEASMMFHLICLDTIYVAWYYYQINSIEIFVDFPGLKIDSVSCVPRMITITIVPVSPTSALVNLTESSAPGLLLVQCTTPKGEFWGNLILNWNEFQHKIFLRLYIIWRHFALYLTRSLGALGAPTSSWRPFGPALGPWGLLDFVWPTRRCNDWITHYPSVDSVLDRG